MDSEADVESGWFWSEPVLYEFGTSLLRPGERYRHHVAYDFGIVPQRARDTR